MCEMGGHESLNFTASAIAVDMGHEEFGRGTYANKGGRQPVTLWPWLSMIQNTKKQ